MTKSRQVKMSGLLAAGVIPAVDRSNPPRPFGVAETDTTSSQEQTNPNTSISSTALGDSNASDFKKLADGLMERDAAIAERDAIIEQLKSGTDRVRQILLSDVDDSPYQPRLEYDPEEIDALAKTMAAASQADPIKVRKVSDRFELISGHRRKRAAVSLGWTEVAAIVENRTDEQAELEAMLLVVANVKLSDYELAQMYDRAIRKGYAQNRDKAAAIFGVTPSAVTGRLEMLSLPQPVLDILKERPRLFGYPTAATIKGLVKDHPKSLEIIVNGIRRLYEENATQSGLKGWILQAIAQHSRKASPKLNGRVVTKDGHEIFTTKKTATGISVNIKDDDVDREQLGKDLHAWLTTYANRDKEH